MVTERRIERHELVLDVVRNWVKGTTNRLVFVENVGRYALYDSDHQVAVLEYCSKTARGGGGGGGASAVDGRIEAHALYMWHWEGTIRNPSVGGVVPLPSKILYF